MRNSNLGLTNIRRQFIIEIEIPVITPNNKSKWESFKLLSTQKIIYFRVGIKIYETSS